MLMAMKLEDGKFVLILTAAEMLKRKTTTAISKYMSMSTLQHEHAMGYTTASDLPPEVSSSTLIVVPADLEGLFENGKGYLMTIDGLLFLQELVKVKKGRKAVVVWRVIWRVKGLG